MKIVLKLFASLKKNYPSGVGDDRLMELESARPSLDCSTCSTSGGRRLRSSFETVFMRVPKMFWKTGIHWPYSHRLPVGNLVGVFSFRAAIHRVQSINARRPAKVF